MRAQIITTDDEKTFPTIPISNPHTTTHHTQTTHQYSFSLTTFSPSGKLVQIEHALSAVNQGATSLGIKAKNGVVIATEKKLPSVLVDQTSVKKIVQITPEVRDIMRARAR